MVVYSPNLKFTYHLLNVNFSISLMCVMSVTVHSLFIHVLHGYMCNVCPLYIPFSCNVCPLYIPITFIICMFKVQVHPKPVYSTCAHKTSLQYRCTLNQFTV